MNHLFPIFLKLENLHTLIVGGGYVGLEKLTAILENAPLAQVTLVAPEISKEIKAIAEQNSRLQLIAQKFQESDLQDKDLVIVATNDKLENKRIKALAASKHLLCNVADTPAECDFYLSSIVRKGNLKVAISTNGMSPTMAKRLKEVLNEALPENLETALEQLKAVRDMLKGDFTQKVEALNSITSVLIEKTPSTEAASEPSEGNSIA
jgi:precorrin-2 dehydrogenase/sirohydrochlorin ferrochelatase